MRVYDNDLVIDQCMSLYDFRYKIGLGSNTLQMHNFCLYIHIDVVVIVTSGVYYC